MITAEALRVHIEKWLSPWLEERPEYFLVDVKLSPGPKLQVFMDGDQGIKIDTCVEISRLLEKELDEQQPLGAKYVLEVSSPGMDNPLKVHRQYLRRVGREVHVVQADGVTIDGVLKKVEDDRIWVEQMKKVSKKKKEPVEHEILFDQIKRTKLKLNF